MLFAVRDAIQALMMPSAPRHSRLALFASRLSQQLFAPQPVLAIALFVRAETLFLNVHRLRLRVRFVAAVSECCWVAVVLAALLVDAQAARVNEAPAALQLFASRHPLLRSMSSA